MADARTPAERFAEIEARDAPGRRALLVFGGDARVRAVAIERLARAVGEPVVAWSADALASRGATVVVPDVIELSHAEQLALRDALARREVRVVAGLSIAAIDAVQYDRLRPELYHRLSIGSVDLDRSAPDV
jgi:hypothetical protein